MTHYLRGYTVEKIKYIRGDGPPKTFNPSRAYIACAVNKFLNDGGRIKKMKRVLFEPKNIKILFNGKKRHYLF